MAKRQPSSEPGWKDVKTALSGLDRPGLLALIQDLYSAHTDTRTFLHARFDLGGDVLKPYKKTIARWLAPDVDQEVSVSKANQAIASYKNAVGNSAVLAELMVFYCEYAARFSSDVGYQESAYLNGLTRMFEQALNIAVQLPAVEGSPLIARLDKVRTVSHNIGYGIGDHLDFLFAEYTDR
jgi:hypothetical protein